MLLRGLSWLVVFQLVGTALNVLFFPVLPGPIIGLVLLFIYLLLQGRVNEPLNEAATSVLRYLPLLLVPPEPNALLMRLLLCLCRPLMKACWTARSTSNGMVRPMCC